MIKWKRGAGLALAVVIAFSLMMAGMTVSVFAEIKPSEADPHSLIHVSTESAELDQLPVSSAELAYFEEGDVGISGPRPTGAGVVDFYELQETDRIKVTTLKEGVKYLVQVRELPKIFSYGQTYYMSEYNATLGDFNSLTKDGTFIFGKSAELEQVELNKEMTFGLPLKLPLKEFDSYDEVLYHITVSAVKGEWWGNDAERDSYEFYCKVIEKDPVKRFTDVPGNAWYREAVNTACRLGLINGRTTITFVPEGNLTYAEAVKLAACMNQKYTEGEVSLENGTPNWYDSYVAYAKEKGVIDKDYDWNAMATRAGYVEIFAKALPEEAFSVKNEVKGGAVPDVAMDHPQADAIYKLYRAGILNGNDKEGSFKPDNNIRRCEVAAILTRMMDPDSRVDVSL